MYLAVILFDKTLLVIPAAWCCNLNIVYHFNYGLKSNKKKIIFFSNDDKKEPSFLVQMKEKFDIGSDACYNAYILRAFDDKEKANEFLKRRRGIIPPQYNKNNPENDILRSTILREMELDTKKTIKKEISQIRSAMLTKKIVTYDLTASDTEDIQNGIDDSSTTIDEEFDLLNNEQNSNEKTTHDVISGNIAFSTDKYGGRNYIEHNILMRSTAVAVFEMYNQRPLYRTEIFDTKFVYFLVLEILGKQNVLNNCVELHQFNFAERLFDVRIENQPNAVERKHKFHKLIIDKMTEIKEKYNAEKVKKNDFDRMREALQQRRFSVDP